MKAAPFALFALCVSLFSACADDFDPASRVSELRLLAVHADRPFALPGDEVNLSALAFDPEGRELSWGWGVCLEPASTIALDCLRALSFDSLTIAPNTATHSLRVPEVDAPYLGVVVVVCPGTIAPGDTLGVPLSCMDASGAPLPLAEFELGLKRIFLRDSALNRNPVISELWWDGAPWPEEELKLDACMHTEAGACDRFAEHTLEVRAPGAAEHSVDRDGAPIEEQAVVQLYATGGSFEDDARIADAATTTWRARPEDAGGRITFWFVIRDDRGGVSWISRSLQVP